MIRSSGSARPDPSLKDPKPNSSSVSALHANDDDGAADGNSDAETIVLPGKDGQHSPSKARKIIKREDKSDGEGPSSSLGRKHANGKQDREGDKGDRGETKDKSVSVAGNGSNGGAPALAGKRKKLTEKSKNKDGSSGLSSAPASPPQRRRRSSNAHSNTHSKSDSETAQVDSPRMSAKEKPKSLDKLVPHKRKAPKAESDDEVENRKVRRQRTSGSGLDASRKQHASAKPHHDAHSSTRTRSVSPQHRIHRRSTSTQLPGQSSNGLSHKKKRIPAPLQSTDYHSDESSADGSPHPRSSKLRSLTTPATADSTISPAKMAPHKKHLDAHGQTFLARASKTRLQERPEDINEIVKLLVDAGCNLDFVRILLAAGEPIDRVNEEMDNADDIRRALHHHPDHTDARASGGTVRSTKTSNHLLYMPMDDKTLRAAAARGEEETVIRILQSMVAAARALGKANPDPAPIAGLNDYSTPMLAAIGQENIKSSFNPTRKYGGETYYEIARRRQETMLKSAYDDKSPNRREQNREPRQSRTEPKDESARAHKRKASSPARESKNPREKRRRGPGRPKKEDRIPTIAISDPKAKPASSEGETGERDKNRRASMTSNAPRDEPEKGQKTEKDDSRDRLSVSGESSGKRHPTEKDGPEVPERQRLKPASSDDRHLKASTARDSELRPRKAEAPAEHGRRESGKSVSSENSIHVKSEEPDVDMKRQAEAEAEARELKRKEEEKKRKEEEEKEKERLLKLEEEAKRQAEAEARRREDEERKRREEEEERKRKEEEERKQRELEEQKRRVEEEDRKRKEEERKKKEEEERKRREEEEVRKRREEEERLRREQLEREAAEEARRKREEEERLERERKERLHREEMERRRAAREAEQRRIRLQQERIRLDKLPPLLRWLDGSANPKTPEVAEKFSLMQGVRYDCIRPEATGTPDGREQWLLNTQVALLLGEKDLELSRYTAWTRIPVSSIAKRIIWRLESDRYALTSPSLYELGKQLPEYYGQDGPERMSYRVIEKLRGEAWNRFSAMDMFFVKASDFMYTIPTIQHLHDVKLTIAYRELPEDEAQLAKWAPLQKWKNDPDANRFYGFAPSNKHFINGGLVSEGKPGLCAVSKSPFPEKRVPRRGFVEVTPDDPDYSRICKEQGITDLTTAANSPLLANGVHSSPMSTSSRVNGLQSPHTSSTVAAVALTTNGTGSGHSHGNQPISPSSEAGPAQARPLVNGDHQSIDSGTL
ncbi:hypothetical protein B0H66DRAFT_574595 [Apodospora peruviana]|uniref:Uncharacterized protein n=1 Tax=Apodospora peruviana TaxID=516989 RepID=A0AAE0IC11_9PEZI|nr:hypothetical protein B0H66DRAFT_574595 [Apodospora peruviana]